MARPLYILLLWAFAQATPLVGQEALEDLEALLDQNRIERLEKSYGEDLRGLEAYEALLDEKFVRARELAEAILRDDPNSIAGHGAMGMVQHHGEGNLPVALYHLKKSRDLFEARYGAYPSDGTPWRWHAMSLTEMAFVSGEMGRHQDKIDLLVQRDSIYDPPQPAEQGWPYMRLRQYDRARIAAEAGIATGEQNQIATALTVLCAVEAELLLREASYDACVEAANHDRDNGSRNPTPFTNAAEAALGMLRFSEAEKFMQEGSRNFVYGTASNPWLDLTQLYLAEGRTAEALDAVRKMFQWRNRQPAYMDEQNRAETELTSAIFLTVAGRAREAAKLSSRTLDRPDRTGFTSSESEQMQAAAALVDRMAHATLAERLEEEASWSSWRDVLPIRAAALKHRLRSWASGRRAASLLSDQRILLSTLQPYLAGAVEAPEWLEPELIAPMGSGVLKAALAEAKSRETLLDAEGYFLAWETEIAVLEGHEKKALELADQALVRLPGPESLLRARVTVLAAQAAFRRGDLPRSVAFFDQAMQLDPGAIRRLGASLPAVFYESPGPIAEAAADYLRDSPRFRHSPEGGFQVRVEGESEGGSAFLLSPVGTVLATVTITPRAGDTVETMARRLAKEFHEAAFAPRLDLTQADLRTLDGSPAAGRSQERLHSVLTEVVEESERP